MSPKFFKKHLPDRESIRANRWLAWMGVFLDHPALWRLNRDSVAGAVAIGLFSGLVPGPLQMLTAVLLAVPLKKNLPVALACTFYTNPFTIVPLYIVAYHYGRFLTGSGGNAFVPPYEMDWGDWVGSMQGLVDWMLSLGKPLAVGLVALALSLAFLGYFFVQVAWRAYVVHAWRTRPAARRDVR